MTGGSNWDETDAEEISTVGIERYLIILRFVLYCLKMSLRVSGLEFSITIYPDMSDGI